MGCTYQTASNYCQKVLGQEILKLIYLTKCELKRVNVKEEEPVEQDLLTGFHVIQRIRCKKCLHEVGWKYVK